MVWTVEQPFQSLALTGGGYRGLFTARALQEMEEHIKEPIGRHFDLTYGTCRNGVPASTYSTASRLRESGKVRLVLLMDMAPML